MLAQRDNPGSLSKLCCNVRNGREIDRAEFTYDQSFLPIPQRPSLQLHDGEVSESLAGATRDLGELQAVTFDEDPCVAKAGEKLSFYGFKYQPVWESQPCTSVQPMAKSLTNP